MSDRKFNVIIEEDLRDEVVIIPKQWVQAKAVKARVMCGVGTKADSEQPWVSLALIFATRNPEVCTLVNQDEVKLEYSPFIALDKSGRAISGNQNVDFSKMLKICGVDLKDPDVKEALTDAVNAAKTDEETLKVYYEKLGALCVGPKEYNIQIDQKPSYRDKSLKENFISKIALLEDDD